MNSAIEQALCAAANPPDLAPVDGAAFLARQHETKNKSHI